MIFIITIRFIFASIIIFSASCYTLHQYNGLKILKSETEMILDNDKKTNLPNSIIESDSFKELIKIREIKDRSAVESSVNSIQRLILQLDRSDGRPDFTADVLASKYYNFVSTCLRCGGTAWTAVLGPMDYIGLKFKDFVTDIEVGGEIFRIIKIADFCIAISRILLDVNLKEDKSVDTLLKFSSETKFSSIIDLSYALIRIIIRYAIFKENFDNHVVEEASKQTKFSSIELELLTSSSSLYPIINKNNNNILAIENNKEKQIENIDFLYDLIIPKKQRLESLIEFDFNIDEEDLPIKGSTRILIKFDASLKNWVQVNDLK
jgi:hypothetical protein